MPQTTVKKQNYKDLRTPIIPQRIVCEECHTIFGQMIRLDEKDKSKGFICLSCLLKTKVS